MKTYKSHKTVQAARIIDVYGTTLVLGEGEEFLLTELQKTKFSNMANEAGFDIEDGYVVQYEDGYVSWSPDDVFEKGYTEVTEMNKLSEEEFIIYSNLEVYLRAAIIELANIEGSNLDVVNCLVNTISNIKYAAEIRRKRQRKSMEVATKCGL